MARLFGTHTQAAHGDSLAHFMPGGRIFSKKWTDASVLRRFLLGLAAELQREEERMSLIYDEYDMSTTTNLIEEWESAVGIPDDCFSGAGSLADRRKAVLAKFAMMNITKEQDFIDLAAIFGVTITLEYGTTHGVFPLTFPLTFFSSAREARFTLIIDFPGALAPTFPLTFPILFGASEYALVRCILEHLKPANVQLIFRGV